MGYIYKITNKINNKVYIGQTNRTIEIRWKEHCRHLKSNMPICKAINKYGKENFLIEKLEECSDILLDKREQYWIEYYNSFNKENGYNATFGGQNSGFIMTDKAERVKQLWQEGYGQKQIVEKTKLNVETVHGYLIKSGVTTEDIRERQKEILRKKRGKKVLQYDLKGNFIKEWISATEVERQTGISRGNIGAVCNGKRKTAGNFIWRYKE